MNSSQQASTNIWTVTLKQTGSGSGIFLGASASTINLPLPPLPLPHHWCVMMFGMQTSLNVLQLWSGCLLHTSTVLKISSLQVDCFEVPKWNFLLSFVNSYRKIIILEFQQQLSCSNLLEMATIWSKTWKTKKPKFTVT